VAFTSQHPASTEFRLPVMDPYQVRKFDSASLVSLLDSSISVSVSQVRCLQQSLALTRGSAASYRRLLTFSEQGSSHLDVEHEQTEADDFK